MSLSQGLIDNRVLRLLDLGGNQIGSKGTILLCEAIKGNSCLNSLFLDDNKIGSEGAYALSDLLMESGTPAKGATQKEGACNLLELHFGWNMVTNTGLNSLFTSLAMANPPLKFLDITYNTIDIAIMHSLRLMLERNTNLKYLCINDLHRFNETAQKSLARSFAENWALKMVDFKMVTREFFDLICTTVNESR